MKRKRRFVVGVGKRWTGSHWVNEERYDQKTKTWGIHNAPFAMTFDRRQARIVAAMLNCAARAGGKETT